MTSPIPPTPVRRTPTHIRSAQTLSFIQDVTAQTPTHTARTVMAR